MTPGVVVLRAVLLFVATAVARLGMAIIVAGPRLHDLLGV